MLRGQRAPQLVTRTPSTGLSRRQQNRRPRRDRPKPRLQGGRGHTATVWLSSVLQKKGRDRTLTALVGLKGNTPLVPRIKSSILPWEAQAKLQPFLQGPKGKAPSLSHTTNTNKERKGNTHTQMGLSRRKGQRSAANPWE